MIHLVSIFISTLNILGLQTNEANSYDGPPIRRGNVARVSMMRAPATILEPDQLEEQVEVEKKEKKKEADNQSVTGAHPYKEDIGIG